MLPVEGEFKRDMSTQMGFTERFDHVAIGVHEIDQGAVLFRDILGGEPVSGWDVPEEGFRFMQFRYPNRMKIELMEPLGESGFLQKFLARRGAGVHHLTFRVKDIESKLEYLQSNGFEPVHVVLAGGGRRLSSTPARDTACSSS